MSEMTLGQKVREARLIKKMTQKTLAGDFITRNMLSQIENDQATPSMKTLEYLAHRLEKSMGYFLDQQVSPDDPSQLVYQLMLASERDEPEVVIDMLSSYLELNPVLKNNALVMNIYINIYLREGLRLFELGEYEQSKNSYLQILVYESMLMLKSDIVLYKTYSQLSECYSYLRDIEKARDYHQKAKTLLSRLMAGKEVQGIYLKFVEGDYDGLIESSETMDITNYDPYSAARFHMVLGDAKYNREQYEEAIVHYEEARLYYESKHNNSITTLIYENLSQCYSHVHEYKKAFEYLHLVRNRGHNS